MKFSDSKLRREARKQGFVLRRSRWRAGMLDNHGWWQIINDRNCIEAGERFDMTEDDVARFLELTP